ncbi:MAG: SGNH/GDSL hydrolase family protein [Vicingaceae bacterium]
MKPYQIVLFNLSVFAGLLLIMLVFPENGIKVATAKLTFPTVEQFFEIDTANFKSDIELALDSIIKSKESAQQKVDSTIIKRTLDSLKAAKKRIQYPNNDPSVLFAFFEKLDNAKKKKVRIMHYGDSQIEADRITAYVRNELQKKFGGYGAGLFAVVDLTNKMSVKKTVSDNWKRYPGFGRKDSLVLHNKYGGLLSFCRFSPLEKTSEIHNAWIKIEKPTASYGKTRTYYQLNLFYGNSTIPFYCKLTSDGIVSFNDSITPKNTVQEKTFSFSATPKEILLTFSGKYSPDFYALSLEGNNGVVMDNIPLRGASGTEFGAQDYGNLNQMFKLLKPDLLILQFGGNTIPYMKDEERCIKYGKWFSRQISMLKKMNPNAQVIVIGPSDMATKVNGEFTTYPLLPVVKNALKQAAFENNAAFWDMYEAMGGKNTMLEWAASDPPLAAKDYIHFSPEGAKKIATLFYDALLKDYESYKAQQKP